MRMAVTVFGAVDRLAPVAPAIGTARGKSRGLALEQDTPEERRLACCPTSPSPHNPFVLSRKCSSRPGLEAEGGELHGNEVPERHRLPDRVEGEDVVRQVPEQEIRKHRRIAICPKAGTLKWYAEQLLRDLIQKECGVLVEITTVP